MSVRAPQPGTGARRPAVNGGGRRMRGLGGRTSLRLGYRARSLLLALALAALAGALTLAYVRSYKRDVERAVAGVGVLVAARDIPAGTPGSALDDRDLLARREVPRQNVVPGALTSLEQVEGLVVAVPIYAGEQVTARRFRPAGEEGLRGRLDGTLRALSVAGDPNQVLAGVLRDGDRVDVVGTVETPSQAGAAGAASRLILRDVLVLRAPRADGEDRELGAGTAAASVVLALTDTEVEKLFFVLKRGEWSLVLRPAVRAADSLGSPQTAQTVLGGPAGDESAAEEEAGGP